MSLLSIVQAHCKRSALPIPSSVQSTSDPQIVQMLGLLEEFCDDLSTRKAWQATTVEKTFAALAQEDQGDITTMCPGFQQLIFQSFFNRTLRLPVNGGVDSAEWQVRQTLGLTGPTSQFRIRGNRLLFNPTPVAGHLIAFEYFSSYFVTNSVGSTTQPYFVKDDDILLFDEKIAKSYLRWAWKKEKGLEYAEDFVSYQAQVSVLSQRENRPQRVNMGGNGGRGFRPGFVGGIVGAGGTILPPDPGGGGGGGGGGGSGGDGSGTSIFIDQYGDVLVDISSSLVGSGF